MADFIAISSFSFSSPLSSPQPLIKLIGADKMSISNEDIVTVIMKCISQSQIILTLQFVGVKCAPSSKFYPNPPSPILKTAKFYAPDHFKIKKSDQIYSIDMYTHLRIIKISYNFIILSQFQSL